MKIEQAWKTTNFEIGQYKKGNELKGYTIKSPDEIRQQLEDNILILQSLSASKYIRSIKQKVAQWERFDGSKLNEAMRSEKAVTFTLWEKDEF